LNNKEINLESLWGWQNCDNIEAEMTERASRENPQAPKKIECIEQ